MIRRILVAIAVILVIGGAGFWLLTMPRTIAVADVPDHTPDLANGERMFWVGGCDSCHAAAGATGDERFVLGGGVPLETPFGTFHAPNISPDAEEGIGGWTAVDFINAMKMGVGPGGKHLYPAFPYTSYQRMTFEDIIDLKAFLDTLPAIATPSLPHELSFPFTLRRGLGLWQLRYVDGRTFAPDPALSDVVNRGAYLVNGPGHCAECHTPRGFDGGQISGLAFSGGAAFEGDGRIPNITPHETGIGDWSEADIVTFLTTGFTPDFDSAGGAMAAVVQNLAMLPASDVEAMAAYLKTLAPVASTATTPGT